MKRTSRILRRILAVLTAVTALIYPGFMALMSAAGWSYNVRQGNYPAVFSTLAGWMDTGAVLLLLGTLAGLLGMAPKRQVCNIPAIPFAVLGAACCMVALYRFCGYADAHFSGIGESMQPVSELYRDRLLPILLPAFLLLVLAVWNLVNDDAREYRITRRRQREEAENREAPKILGE